jgi:hypothetical protein
MDVDCVRQFTSRKYARMVMPDGEPSAAWSTQRTDWRLLKDEQNLPRASTFSLTYRLTITT